MAETGQFKCLRCSHEYEDKYTPKIRMLLDDNFEKSNDHQNQIETKEN